MSKWIPRWRVVATAASLFTSIFMPGCGPALENKDAIETPGLEARLRPDVSMILGGAQQTAISPDGRKLLLITASDITNVIDIPSGQYCRTSIPFEWHSGRCCITDDGKVVSVGGDGRINGQDKGLPRISPIAFFDKGAKFVAQAREGRDIIVVDVASGTILKRYPIQVEAARLEVTPDGKSIFIKGWTTKGTGSVTAVAIDTASDSVTQETFDCSQSFSLSLSPDGRTIAHSDRTKIEFWSVKDRKVVKTIEGKYPDASYTSKGNLLVHAGAAVDLWNADMSRKIATTPQHGDNTGGSVSEDGRTAFFEHRVYDLETGKVLLPVNPLPARVYSTMIFQKDQILAAGAGGAVWRWKLTAKAPEAIKKGDGTRLSPGAMMMTPDGPQFMTAVNTGRVQFRDLDGKAVRTWDTPASNYMPFPRAISPDRSLWAMSDYKGISLWSYPGNALRRIDILDQDPPDEHRPPPLTPLSMAISPDNKYVAAGYTTVGVYDISSGSGTPVVQIIPVPAAPASVLGFSPDGRLIAMNCGSSRTIRVYDAGSGEMVAACPESEHSYTIAFSPNGQRLAIVESDSTISIWRIPRSPARHDKPDPAAIRGLWEQLGSEDSQAAYAAMNALVAAGSDAVAEQPLTPTPRNVAAKDVDDLIRHLDDNAWRRRDQARNELVRLGPGVTVQAIAAYEKTQSLETKARLAEVLRKVGQLAPTGKDELTAARAVHVLEMIGDDKALAALERVAAGGASRQTLDAKAALTRLKAER